MYEKCQTRRGSSRRWFRRASDAIHDMIEELPVCMGILPARHKVRGYSSDKHEFLWKPSAVLLIIQPLSHQHRRRWDHSHITPRNMHPVEDLNASIGGFVSTCHHATLTWRGPIRKAAGRDTESIPRSDNTHSWKTADSPSRSSALSP